MRRTEKSLVQDPAAHPGVTTARNLADAANAEQSLQGYAAVNGLDEQDEVARVAFDLYQNRGDQPGDADGDWFRAEEEVRRRRRL